MAFSRRSLVVRLRSIIRGGGGGVDLADAVVDVVDVPKVDEFGHKHMPTSLS